eukprot:5135417-Alexandrium_andersonii.AAC.1
MASMGTSSALRQTGARQSLAPVYVAGGPVQVPRPPALPWGAAWLTPVAGASPGLVLPRVKAATWRASSRAVRTFRPQAA